MIIGITVDPIKLGVAYAIEKLHQQHIANDETHTKCIELWVQSLYKEIASNNNTDSIDIELKLMVMIKNELPELISYIEKQ